MNNQVIITNEKLVEFCKHQERIEANLETLCRDVKELKVSMEKQRNDFAKYRSDNADEATRMRREMDRRCEGICDLIGEVPKDKTVMQCVRDNSARMEKLWWGIILVFGVIQFLANYPKFATMFG